MQIISKSCIILNYMLLLNVSLVSWYSIRKMVVFTFVPWFTSFSKACLQFQTILFHVLYTSLLHHCFSFYFTKSLKMLLSCFVFIGIEMPVIFSGKKEVCFQTADVATFQQIRRSISCTSSKISAHAIIQFQKSQFCILYVSNLQNRACCW